MDDSRARELLAEARSTAEEELARLDGRLDADEENPDAGDAANDLRDDEIDAGRVEDLQARLEAIERAEQRLSDGTYGKSVESGDAIPDGRLELVPWADRTVDEESRLP
jgi:DnaK suppressor protein